jgi:hypothetical protein
MSMFDSDHVDTGIVDAAEYLPGLPRRPLHVCAGTGMQLTTEQHCHER